MTNDQPAVRMKVYLSTARNRKHSSRIYKRVAVKNNRFVGREFPGVAQSISVAITEGDRRVEVGILSPSNHFYLLGVLIGDKDKVFLQDHGCVAAIGINRNFNEYKNAVKRSDLDTSYFLTFHAIYIQLEVGSRPIFHINVIDFQRFVVRIVHFKALRNAAYRRKDSVEKHGVGREC